MSIINLLYLCVHKHHKYVYRFSKRRGMVCHDGKLGSEPYDHILTELRSCTGKSPNSYNYLQIKYKCNYNASKEYFLPQIPHIL